MRTTVAFIVVCCLGIFWLGHTAVSADSENEKPTAREEKQKPPTDIKVREFDFGDGLHLKEVTIIDVTHDKPITRYGRITRTNEIIMAYSWDKTQAKAVRNYYHNGREFLCEGDQDGDGFFELLILFDDQHMPIEVFERAKDGTVLPVHGKRLDAIRADYKVANEVIAPTIQSLQKHCEGNFKQP